LRRSSPYGIRRALSSCRRSSGVERTLGKGEADSSILSGGTIFPHIINMLEALVFLVLPYGFKRAPIGHPKRIFERQKHRKSDFVHFCRFHQLACMIPVVGQNGQIGQNPVIGRPGSNTISSMHQAARHCIP
jgi:hypothetical protein